MKVTLEPGRVTYSGAAAVTDVMKMTAAQARFYLSGSRFNVTAAGRRSGKTAIGKRRGVKKAVRWTGVSGAKFIFGGPTQSQAEDIFWEDVKKLVPKWALADAPDETNCKLHLLNGAVIQVFGFDKPQRVEGSPIAHAHLDEVADMKEEAWSSHLRPALTDTQGTADLTGVPEGRNHFWDMWVTALENEDGDWAAHTWKTADVLPLFLGPEAAAREIAAAKRDLDQMTYAQEYEASFNNLEGRIYYGFQRDTHARERLRYNPNRPLVLCFDFNVDPGVCVYAQEQTYRGNDPDVAEDFTALIGEVHIPRSSNTPAVCRKIIDDWHGLAGDQPKVRYHEGDVLCYGDPAGGARSTKSEQGSDWDIIRDHLKRAFGDRLKMRYKDKAPFERVRVNSVNARLLTADGKKHMLADPLGCKRLIDDLEVVCAKEGSAGEIDDQDGKVSHLTDALGYYVEAKHPLRGVNRSVTESM